MKVLAMTNHRAAASLPNTDPLFAPGLKRRDRADGQALYWIPPERDVKAGYAPKSITLPSGLPELEIAHRCREQWRDLENWRSGIPKLTKHTISWLIDRYQNDELSPYRNVRPKTRQSYEDCCKRISRSIGDTLLYGAAQDIVGADIRKWHREWSRPDEDGKPTAPSVARHLVTMLRILFSYAVEIGVPGSPRIRELIRVIRFPTTPARSAAPTREQVLAIVRTALDMGFTSIAIATLAQFELIERRTHIIGCWEGDRWVRGWTWNNISRDWIIRYTQTKVGVVEREFDLHSTPALLEMLQRTPEERRGLGPVIVCERTGKPWGMNHYIMVFAKIRKAAGVSNDIWSMDMRAGGATEAGSLQGITSLDLQAAGGWSDSKMASRYTRDRASRAQNVVNIRQRAKSK